MKLQKLEQLIRDLYESQDKNRADWADWLYENHVFIVGDYARVLARRFHSDYDITVASALLHDIADAVMSRDDESAHAGKSIEIAKKFLTKSGYETKEIELIVNDILPNHSCYNGVRPRSNEGKVMATADALGHLKTNFYTFAKGQFIKNGQSIEKYNTWLLPKIKRDYEVKICFDEMRYESTLEYNTLRQASDEYIKDFDGWNHKKQNVNEQVYNPKLFFEQREVWWSSTGINVGVEADGKHKNFERPILIVKVFNGHMLWGIPLTSKKKAGEHYVQIKHDKGISWANVPQMRVISTKRLLRKIGMASTKDFKVVVESIHRYTKIDPRKSEGLGGRSH